MSISDGEGLVLSTHATDEVFRQVCQEYGVTLVDMSDRFIREYNNSHEAPYGFNNTTIGKGHFNRTGHRMVAEELLNVLR